LVILIPLLSAVVAQEFMLVIVVEFQEIAVVILFFKRSLRLLAVAAAYMVALRQKTAVQVAA
jgi:hypothetical protein